MCFFAIARNSTIVAKYHVNYAESRYNPDWYGIFIELYYKCGDK